MKTRLLSLPFLVAALTCTHSHAEGPKLIQSYTDVLAVIPEEFAPKRISQWTELKKSAVNVILKENITDLHTPAKFQATVSQVAHWPDLTLFWEVPNPEGCHIRVFAHFTDDWKARLSMLNIGDPVIIEGTFFKAAFEDLWGDSTLQLCIGNCTFTKETAANGQTNAAPAVRKTTEPASSASAIDASVLSTAPSSIESPAAKVTVDSSHGAMTFATTDQPSNPTGIELTEKHWTAKELWDSVKDAPFTDYDYGSLIASPVSYSGRISDTPVLTAYGSTFIFSRIPMVPFEASAIRGITFLQSGNSLKLILIFDPDPVPSEAILPKGFDWSAPTSETFPASHP